MRQRNAKGDQNINACVLGRWAWDSDRSICGPDAPDPSTAAKRLADKRWQKSLRIQARKLRDNTGAAIAAAQREGNPLGNHMNTRQVAVAARLARGEI